jgi:single-stranded-DNA-specific exonuclease
VGERTRNGTIKRWRIMPHDRGLIGRLESLAGVSPVVAQLLAARGVHEPDEVKRFLDCKLSSLREPDELPGVTAASTLIVSALRDRRKIVVYGDYDADGMTSTAILFRCLKLLGAEVTYYVPNRLEEGYGLNSEALETLAKRGANLIITVDCGIASLKEALFAKELGLELIVTDHHEMAATLPEAAGIVHPRLPGTNYPFAGLCGAGVAFKLAWAVCQRMSEAKKVSEPMRDYLLAALGLAALGTVADVVPLLDENRVLVRHGLTSLKERPGLGLSALLKLTGLESKPYLTSEDIGFSLAPRLNAAGRLGQAQLGVELLTTESPERARALAEYIHGLNVTRESLERSIQIAAAKQIKEECDVESDPALVLAGRGWHAGVIGIVAGRLAEKYHRPVAIIALDQAGIKPGVGSARSAAGIDLHCALSKCSETLVAFGGHAAAAGFKVEDAQLNAFRNQFMEAIASEAANLTQVAEYVIDAESPISLLSLEVVRQLDRLGPFGQANPRPMLFAGAVSLAEPPKKMGGGERHLSVRFTQHRATLRGVAFGHGERCEELAAVSGPLDIVYRPVINEFRGKSNVEIQLVDFRPSEQSS